MSVMNSVVAIYDSHEQAEAAVKELQEAGVDMKSLSIAGKNTHTDEHVVGYYNAGDRMKYWGKMVRSGEDSGGCCLDPRCLRYPDSAPFLLQGRWSLGSSEHLRVRLSLVESAPLARVFSALGFPRTVSSSTTSR
jgi:hypothetical protein